MRRIAAQAPPSLLHAILPVVAATLLSVPSAQAALTFTGDVSPDPSTWTSATVGYIGNTADGSLMVDGGSILTSSQARMGYTAGVNGTATVTGAGSTWNAGNLRAGWSGNGTVNINNGGVVNGALAMLGYQATASGTVTVDGSGSMLSLTNSLYMGYNGSGVLNVINGGTASSPYTYVGYATGSTGALTLDGSGSTLTSSTDLGVGYSGTGTLTIRNGASVSGVNGSIGYNATGNGTLTIDASTMTLSGSNFWVGQNGTATLNILNGSTVSAAGAVTTIGPGGSVHFGANGGILNTGSILYSASQLSGSGVINTSGIITDGDLVFDASHGATRTLTANGVTVNLNLASSGVLGAGNLGAGTLTIADGVTIGSSAAYLGRNSGSNGTGTIAGPGSTWNISGDFNVGFRGGSGNLRIVNGGTLNDGHYINIGYSGNGTAIVDGHGSTMTTAYLSVGTGTGGNGRLLITNGGSVANSGSANVGSNAGVGTAIVNGVGSSWTSTGALRVNQSGSRLIIADGGTLTAQAVTVSLNNTLTIDIGRGSSLNSGLANNGVVRLVAGAGAANGSYTPISGSVSGNIPWALGGRWDATTRTVAVSSPVTAIAGNTLSMDLYTDQRGLITDPATGKSIGMGFAQAYTAGTNITCSASAIGGNESSALQSLLDPGQTVLSGWNVTTSPEYTLYKGIYLSLFAGSGHSLSDLTVWSYDGAAWSKYDAADLAYDNTYASFTVTGLSGYAVSGTAPVPIPPSVFLFGSGLSGLFFFRRKKAAS